MKSSPRHYQAGTAPPLDVSDWLIGRLVGYLVGKAYEQPYLGQSQAYQRAMGYPVTRDPAVPLQGQIVEDTPGLLEYEQLNTAFSSSAAAEQFAAGAAYDPPGDGAVTVPLGSTFPDAVAAMERNSNPGTESIFHFDWTSGDVEVDMYFRGGRDLSLANVLPLARAGVRALVATCEGKLT
jgi:hypothetical protein